MNIEAQSWRSSHKCAVLWLAFCFFLWFVSLVDIWSAFASLSVAATTAMLAVGLKMTSVWSYWCFELLNLNTLNLRYHFHHLDVVTMPNLQANREHINWSFFFIWSNIILKLANTKKMDQNVAFFFIYQKLAIIYNSTLFAFALIVRVARVIVAKIPTTHNNGIN